MKTVAQRHEQFGRSPVAALHEAIADIERLQVEVEIHRCLAEEKARIEQGWREIQAEIEKLRAEVAELRIAEESAENVRDAFERAFNHHLPIVKAAKAWREDQRQMAGPLLHRDLDAAERLIAAIDAAREEMK